MTNTYKSKCFRRKYLKTSKNINCGNISLNKKNNKKIKGKGMLHIYCLHDIKFINATTELNLK